LVFEQEGAKSDREDEAEIFGPITSEHLKRNEIHNVLRVDFTFRVSEANRLVGMMTLIKNLLRPESVQVVEKTFPS
jgi:hypothetical protein